MAASDRNARILQAPVIMTTDNTEAKIIVGEERPIVTSTTTSSDTDNQTSHYEYKDVGVEVAVTPHINPERFVVMDIKQTANNVQGTQKIDDNDVPIITKREMEAQVAVKSRSTIALGGLIQTDHSKSRSKVPILGDIPLLGALFRSESRDSYRTELLVLITPYVLMTPEEARAETLRLKNASRAGETPWPRGWSDSPLATPGPKELAEQKKAEKARKKKEAQDKRAAELRQRMEERRMRREKMMDDPLWDPDAIVPVDEVLTREEQRNAQIVPASAILPDEQSVMVPENSQLDPVVLTATDDDGNPFPLEGNETIQAPETILVPQPAPQPSDDDIEVEPDPVEVMTPVIATPHDPEEELDMILRNLQPIQ